MILLILRLDFQNFGFLLGKVQTGVFCERRLLIIGAEAIAY